MAVYGLLLNDTASLRDLGDAMHAPPYMAPPSAPVMYMKPRNTWAADGDAIALPAGVDVACAGGALGVVIGRKASRVSEGHALAHVAGYVAVNDVFLPHSDFLRPQLERRCRDGFCTMSAPAAPAGGIDPDRVLVRVLVNGEVRQSASTASLVRPIARVIADISEFLTLDPGDTVLAGVPLGAPEIRRGDVVAVEIDGVGRVENPVVGEELL